MTGPRGITGRSMKIPTQIESAAQVKANQVAAALIAQRDFDSHEQPSEWHLLLKKESRKVLAQGSPDLNHGEMRL